jgi:di/tricarboxylate transporter
MEIAIVLGLLVIAIILFASEKFSVDLVTVGLLIVLTSIGILTPEEAFRGFGSDFIIMLASIFVVGAAVQQAGVLEIISDKFENTTRERLTWLPVYLMSTVGVTSAFMNNTTVTAMFVAPVTAIAKKLGTSPSKLLIPVAFASILGGTCTVIGTSTNIAVNAFLAKHGYPTFGMFDFAIIGGVMMITGIVFMATIGTRLLPGEKDVNLIKELESKHFFTEIIVMPGSVLSGQKVRDTTLSQRGFKILNIIREEQNSVANGYTIIEAGDILLVEGNIKVLLKLKNALGVEIFSEFISEADLNTEEIRLAEAIVTPPMTLSGKL